MPTPTSIRYTTENPGDYQKIVHQRETYLFSRNELIKDKQGRTVIGKVFKFIKAFSNGYSIAQPIEDRTLLSIINQEVLEELRKQGQEPV